MKCRVCQAELAAGAPFCTNCGTPVQSNPYGNPASPSSPNQGIAPTMLASSTPPPPDPYVQPANPYNAPPANPYGMPPTNYGAGTQQPANPYSMPPASPYGTPPPAYDPNTGGYGTPPPAYDPNTGGYGGGAPYGQPPFVPQQPKKSNRGCVIAAVIVIVLFVLIVGGTIAGIAYTASKVSQTVSSAVTNLDATATADTATANSFGSTPTGSTPTTSTSGSVPVASQIDPTAQSNITSAQTSHGVDTNFKPTNVTSTFTSGQTVDIAVTFAGNAGFAKVKIYLNGTFDTQSSSPLTIHSTDATGDFPFTSVNTGSFVAGIYWCQQADCSDAALAQVVNFTIS